MKKTFLTLAIAIGAALGAASQASAVTSTCSTPPTIIPGNVADCAVGSANVGDLSAVIADNLFGTTNWYEVDSGSMTPVYGVTQETTIIGASLAAKVDIDGLNGNQLAAVVATALDDPSTPNFDESAGLNYVAFLVDASVFTDGMTYTVTFQNPFPEINDPGGNAKVVDFDVRVVVTPVPAALPLIATGLAALGFVARRRKAA